MDATLWSLHQAGICILQLYAPYMPYITEALYQELYKSRYQEISLHKTEFAQVQKKYSFPESVTTIELVLAVAEQVRKLKTEKQLSLKVELAELIITCTKEQKDIIEQQSLLIMGITHAHAITCNNGQNLEVAVVLMPEVTL